jgi:hypothetical protein
MAFKHGHYIDSGLSMEEREKRLQASLEADKKYTSWDDVPEVFEAQDSDDYNDE